MTQLPTLSRTSQVKPKFATVLLYAIAKLGKTTTVVKTIPNFKETGLILATEDGDTQGLQSIQDLDVPYLEIRDWETFELVHAEMMKKKGECQYQGYKVENTVVDSYSCCGHLWMEDALKKLKWDEIGLGRGRAGLQPYSYIAEKGRQATKKLMMLQSNLVVIAREGVAESGMGTEDYKSIPCIELPGAKLFNELPGSFDAVIRMRSINGKRVFVTTEENGAMAGVRVPEGVQLPRYVEPNVGALIRLVLGDRSALNDLTIQAANVKAPAVQRR